MKSLRFAVALVFLIAMAGCRAHVVKISLTNTSAAPIKTIIVDYPTATFGKDTLAPGETFSSPVKLTDDGALKVQFTDANGRNHTCTGPALHRNQEGSIDIRLDQNGIVAQVNISLRVSDIIQNLTNLSASISTIIVKINHAQVVSTMRQSSPLLLSASNL